MIDHVFKGDACSCGFVGEDRDDLERHVDTERSKIHSPYYMTTSQSIAPAHPPPCGIEFRSTPYGDAHDAIEVTLVVPDGPDGVLRGHYQRHTILVWKNSLDFLAESLTKQRHAKPEGDA